MRRRATGSQRVGSALFGLGCVTLLAVTFWGGVLTGRYWARQSPGTPAPASRAVAEASSSPRLTYYEELTAPLRPLGPATGLPAAREGRGEAAVDAPGALVKTAPEPVPVRREETAVRAVPGPAAGRRETAAEAFTIQVGAYRSRTQAEALRSRLTAAGYPAYVSEAERGNGARYRVRVGAYPTRDRADETAVRLRQERVPTYVLPR
jgi:cell division protein FtsN